MNGTRSSFNIKKLITVLTMLLGLMVLGSPAAATAATSAAPVPPSIPDLVAASDTGSSDSDNVTANTTLSFSGTVEPGATVKLFAGTTLVGSGTADRRSGAYAITATLREGTYAMAVTATDAAGNESALSLPLRITIDTTAPRVIRQVPTPGSMGVPITADVVAQFNEPVVGVKNDTFTLGRHVAARVDYNRDTRTATLDPDASLAHNTTYTASLLESISDIAGNRMTALGWSFTTARDTTPPVVQAPAHSLLSDYQLESSSLPGTVKVKLRWSATDSSGVSTYTLQQSTNGGAFSTVPLSSSTADSSTLALMPGNTYQFRVRATDQAGNVSSYVAGSRFTVSADQEPSTALKYVPRPHWKTAALSGAYGGAVQHTSKANAKATFTFTGQSVALVSTKGNNRGNVEIWLDGAQVATLDLYAPSTQPRQVVFASNGLTAGSHQLEVRVLDTKHRSSAGGRVDIDALLVMR